MLSKLFTQSHRAERFKLRLISGFNQNKLRYSFDWPVEPRRACPASWPRERKPAALHGAGAVRRSRGPRSPPCSAALPSASARARTSARLRGQAPVTILASPVSQEGEVWLSGLAGGGRGAVGKPQPDPSDRHLYVSGGWQGYTWPLSTPAVALQFKRVKMIFFN